MKEAAKHDWLICSTDMLRHFRARWKQHERRAFRDGTPFKLAFDEWMKIWLDSGHLMNRGIQEGQYVMGRYGDKGAYELTNVSIITQAQNTSDGNRGSPRRGPRLKQSIAMKDQKKSAEHKLRIGEAQKASWALGERPRVASLETRQKMSIAHKARADH
jgi:hypothetical protein